MSNNAKRNKVSGILHARSSVNSIIDSLRVHCATVFWVKKMMKERKSIKCTKLTGRKCASRTEDATKAIIKSLKKDPTKSMRFLAKEHFLAPATVPKIVKEAGGKFKAIVKRPLLSKKDPGYRTGACEKM